MDFSNYKFRCSQLKYLMTESRSSITELQLKRLDELSNKEYLTEKQKDELKKLIEKKDKKELGDTVKNHLLDVYVSKVFGRNSDIHSKFIEKGNEVEELSITLYTNILNKYLKKNEQHFENDFIRGTPDIVTDIIIDTKSSWDIFTFAKSTRKKYEYYWQMQGYMELCDKEIANVVYCLVSTPDSLIEREINKIIYSGGINLRLDEFRNELNELYKHYRYDDIPIEKRFHVESIVRDRQAISKLYNRIGECREYLNSINW